MRKSHQVLFIGPDLFCRGGIASVVTTLFNVEEKSYNYTLLKSFNYKDKGRFFKFTRAVKAFIKLFFLLLSDKFDIIHIHSSMGASFYRKSFFLLLAKSFNRKVIVHLHSSAFDDFFIDAKGIKKNIIKFVLSRPDKLFVLCEDWKSKLNIKYSLNAEVVHNPIHLQPVKPTRPKPKTIEILFLGFFVTSKGVNDLVKVCNHYQRSTQVKFVIAGQGKMESTIRDIIFRDKLNNVNLVGWVNEEVRNELLGKADILFLPSYKEGMPMAILEAISHSVPVISTNIAGIPELVINGSNGFILCPGDVDGFINKIDFFINCSEATYNDFRRNSRQIANSFSDKIILEKIEDIYSSILQPRSDMYPVLR